MLAVDMTCQQLLLVLVYIYIVNSWALSLFSIGGSYCNLQESILDITTAVLMLCILLIIKFF